MIETLSSQLIADTLKTFSQYWFGSHNKAMKSMEKNKVNYITVIAKE